MRNLIVVSLAVLPLIAAAFIFEYQQGMIMLQNGDWGDADKTDGKGGVKSHKYYSKFYHAMITVAALLCFIAGGAVSYTVFVFPTDIVNHAFITYILVIIGLVWEAAEIAYSLSRYGKAFAGYERINIAEIFKGAVPTGVSYYILHGTRVVVGLWALSTLLT